MTNPRQYLSKKSSRKGADRPVDYPRPFCPHHGSEGTFGGGTGVTGFAGEGDVVRLCGRLAYRLGDDSSVRLAWLHGSRVRGSARSESDIDVAVLLGEEYAGRKRSVPVAPSCDSRRYPAVCSL